MNYIPDRYDIIYVNLQPRVGSEIAKRRPCLVLTPSAYNKFGKCLVCPITNYSKGIRTEVPLPKDQPIAQGVILADQIRSLDWKARKAEKFDQLEDSLTYGLVAKIVEVLISE